MPEPFALVLSVAGTPRPQPRPRFVGGRVVSTGGRKPKAWQAAIERAARAAVSNVTPEVVQQEFARHGLRLWLLFEFPTRRPERWGRPHTIRPDGDNLAKAVADALTRAGALGGDDSRIMSWVVEKRWAERGGVAIRVERWNDAAARDRSPPPALAGPPSWLR